MWVCRAGKKAKYVGKFLEDSKIYLPWNGFCMNLQRLNSMQDFRELVGREMQTDNKTSISNWAGQLYAFCHSMELDDFVIIPHPFSHEYTLARIKGEYMFDDSDILGLFHSREIDVIKTVPRNVFSQSMQYSLGAYRTIFMAKNEGELLKRINDYPNV